MADGERILARLPAVFTRADATGELRRLAAGLEALLFGDDGEGDDEAAGYELRIERIPGLFAPSTPIKGLSPCRTPDHLLGWLADWLSFTPHALFAPDRLRIILAGIVPLNGSRGTRRYLEALLTLAFGDALATIMIDDDPHAGLAVGKARIGTDARLGGTPPLYLADVPMVCC